jgi:hypothetical protein
MLDAVREDYALGRIDADEMEYRIGVLIEAGTENDRDSSIVFVGNSNTGAIQDWSSNYQQHVKSTWDF